jgi:hypothetical protein
MWTVWLFMGMTPLPPEALRASGAEGVRSACPAVVRQLEKVTGAALGELIRDVAAGKRSRIAVAFASRRLLDGSELEDLDQALGALGERAPGLFLSEAIRHCYSDVQIGSVIVTLPLDSADDVPRRKEIIRARIRGLESIRSPTLSLKRDVALAALRDSLESLERVSTETAPP